ncbi:hypothetical protein [Phytoactinopolyspora limicola]|uniref:hypothetical protein n=1 Tax=Phytoactinopolyspora limicola TaxID=2715536 RepID=UPI00140B33D4|nr:hypothetical protein [Phytoactinopolyspora limicola]
MDDQESNAADPRTNLRRESGGAWVWPTGWRRTDRRARAYAAAGHAGVRVVDVDIDAYREPGLLLPMHPTPRWRGIGFLALGAVFIALAVVIGIVAVVDGLWAGIVGLLVLGGVGAVFVLGGLATLKQRRDAVPGLRLTPSRVVFDAGLDRLGVPWDEITELRTYTIRYGINPLMPRPWQNWFSVDVRDVAAVLRPSESAGAARTARRLRGSTAFAVPDRRLALDPVVAYQVLRYYLDHPADRTELGTPTSVARVAEGRLFD